MEHQYTAKALIQHRSHQVEYAQPERADGDNGYSDWLLFGKLVRVTILREASVYT
jgi:hypothetical protein